MAKVSNINLNGTSYTVKDPNAQETLVSGTNIKTINNQSLLGSGNITISGGSGGGETVIELTQQEYDALTEYAEDTTYIITDATPINMDDYATTAETSAITQSVSALSGTVANKADKANVTARSSGYRFPYWNSQGIITGSTDNLTNGPAKFNGVSLNLIKTSGTFPNIYAPTSAGTQNTPLLSNGSGAPVWASFKFWYGTQTQYDAITTKDSSTIYFVKPD